MEEKIDIISKPFVEQYCLSFTNEILCSFERQNEQNVLKTSPDLPSSSQTQGKEHSCNIFQGNIKNISNMITNISGNKHSVNSFKL